MPRAKGRHFLQGAHAAARLLVKVVALRRAASGVHEGVPCRACRQPPATVRRLWLVAQVRHTEEEWMEILGKDAYRVLRQAATERPRTRWAQDQTVGGAQRQVGWVL